jgi:hypothetical protein
MCVYFTVIGGPNTPAIRSRPHLLPGVYNQANASTPLVTATGNGSRHSPATTNSNASIASVVPVTADSENDNHDNGVVLGASQTGRAERRLPRDIESDNAGIHICPGSGRHAPSQTSADPEPALVRARRPCQKELGECGDIGLHPSQGRRAPRITNCC